MPANYIKRMISRLLWFKEKCWSI